MTDAHLKILDDLYLWIQHRLAIHLDGILVLARSGVATNPKNLLATPFAPGARAGALSEKPPLVFRSDPHDTITSLGACDGRLASHNSFRADRHFNDVIGHFLSP
jgi:hypothetical protein